MNEQNNQPIYVTQPSLPPLEEYVEYLKGIWERGILTHNGPLVQEFEKQLCDKLNVSNFITATNGTSAIQMAIKALEIKGEIITTAFSWIATISAIKWEGCVPVFCDIEPETFNIDVEKIESLITDKTVAIMPVHVFGNPCNVEQIEFIAKKHNLKVIYDGAHAIGTTVNSKSVLEWGDITATSLHGTKLLNTAEGGGCITVNPALNEKLKRIRFFGHNESKEIIEDGFNAKMTEVHAALGLANLIYFDEVLADRKHKYMLYYDGLRTNKNLSFQKLNGDGCNYSYFPVVFETEQTLVEAEKKLNEQKIFPRRYFYPSLNTLNYDFEYQPMPESESISKRILCMPLYKNLQINDIEKIVKLIV